MQKAALILSIFLFLSGHPTLLRAFFTSSATSEQISFTTRQAYPEFVQNGQFLEDLDHWQYSEGVLREATDQYSFAVHLEGDQSPSVSQMLIFPNASKRFLSFWYQLSITEPLPGFDEPSFLVFANDLLIYSSSQTSEWREVVVPLPAQTHIQLTFNTQNTGDDRYPPQLSLSAISTAVPFQGVPSLKVISDMALGPNQRTLRFTVPPTQHYPVSYELNELRLLPTYQVSETQRIFSPPEMQELLALPQVLPKGSYSLIGRNGHDTDILSGVLEIE